MAFFQMNFFSPTLCFNTDINVVVPTPNSDEILNHKSSDYFHPGARFQVLYLLHGAYGDYSDWMRLTSIEKYAQNHKLAVVMPSASNSFYQDMYRGSRYFTYLTEELPGLVRSIFPVSTRRENTFVAGLSMGGYGCMRVGLEFPERFAAIASLSGALDMQALRENGGPHMEKMDRGYSLAVYGDRNLHGSRDDLLCLLKDNLAKGKPMPRLYMTIGTEDFLYPVNEAFYARAKELADIRYETFPGVHDWIFWDAHIQDVMSWLPLAEGKVDA